jgi:hypothetical protein
MLNIDAVSMLPPSGLFTGASVRRPSGSARRRCAEHIHSGGVYRTCSCGIAANKRAE